MSIIGAAGVGLAISGIVIKFQKSVYDKKIAELKGYANELDSHLTVLEGYKKEVPNFWNDDTGKEYVRVIDTQIRQLTTARQRVDDLSNLYDELKSALSGAQSTTKQKVDDIAGIVGALTGSTE